MVSDCILELCKKTKTKTKTEQDFQSLKDPLAYQTSMVTTLYHVATSEKS